MLNQSKWQFIFCIFIIFLLSPEINQKTDIRPKIYKCPIIFKEI